jgi:hypothetical protein
MAKAWGGEIFLDEQLWYKDRVLVEDLYTGGLGATETANQGGSGEAVVVHRPPRQRARPASTRAFSARALRDQSVRL